MNSIYKFYRLLQPVFTGYPLIRLGKSSDGGYLVPDCLSGIECCVSPGVCEDYEFEELLADTYGIPSVMCDPQHDAPDDLNPLLFFEKKALSSTTCANKNTITINDLLKKYDLEKSNPLILSMDIEGAEYEVLPSIVDWHKYRIIVIELHALASLHITKYQESLVYVINLVENMLEYFDVVHFRPNNHVPFFPGKLKDSVVPEESSVAYACIELTLLNKCMRKHQPLRIDSRSLPNRLDKKNNINNPEVNYQLYDRAWSKFS